MGRRLLTLGALLVGLTACLSRAPDRSARAAEKDGGMKPPEKLDVFYTSATSCSTAGCHGRETPMVDKELPPLCRCIEANIWQGKGTEYPGDKHRDAFNVLKGPRAREMGELLGWKQKPEEAPECLSCHGFSARGGNLDRPDTIVEEGVTCVVCHGPYKGWVDAHHGSFRPDDRKAWRDLSRVYKDEKWGMRDLWDPATRARLCASCHVGSLGDREEKTRRVVTHEMYAAGHPPLPSFEPTNFSEVMQHWEYRADKPKEVRTILDYKGEKERAQLVAVGGAVVFESSVRLLAGQAKECAEKSRTLDVANFDCAACHHELRSPSWRQERGFAGSQPGRPPAPAWPAALLRPTVACSEDFNAKRTEEALKTYEALAAELKKSLAARPYGKPVEVADSAAKLADWAAGLAKAVGKPMQEQEARLFLRALCELPPGEVPDYDSARQIAWAVKMVALDLEPKQAVEQRFTALNADLRLTLPQGHKPTIVDQLDDALQARNRYDPKVFRERLAGIAAALK
jgi:hypothetical protein